MQNSIISFTIILVVFLSSLISFVSTKAISLTEIIVTNQVESLKPEQGTKQLRIVDHDGLILVPKVKVVKTEIEIAKPAVKEVMKMAKTEEKKVDEKSAVKTEIKPDVKTLIKAENIKKTDLNLVSKVENNPKVETPTAIKPQVKTAPKEEAKEVPEVRDLKSDSSLNAEVKNNIQNSVNNTKTVAEIKDLIQVAAQKYEVDPELMLKLASCESGFKASAVGSGRYFGIYQFSKPTFVEYANKMNLENADPLNPEQNIEVAAYMIQNGQIARWGCKV